MSVIQLNRAYRVRVGSPSLKLVLIMIADAMGDGGNGWVAVSRMVLFSELSERFIRNAIAKLTSMGLIHVDRQAGGHRANSYQLDLPTWRGEKEEYRVIADAWKGAPRAGSTVQPVQGAPGAGVQPVQGDGAPGAGGMVHRVQGEGAPGAPYPSYSSQETSDTHPGPGQGPAGCLEFPADFPELMQGAMTAWWNYKAKRGQSYQQPGWRALLRLAAKHTLEEVTTVVAIAIRNEWNGLYFRQTAKSGQAAGSEAVFREKKEGGGGGATAFGSRGIEPAGFAWEALTFLEKGYAPTVPWHEQTARFRSDLRALWAGLSPDRRAEVEAEARRGKSSEKRDAAA